MVSVSVALGFLSKYATLPCPFVCIIDIACIESSAQIKVMCKMTLL